MCDMMADEIRELGRARDTVESPEYGERAKRVASVTEPPKRVENIQFIHSLSNRLDNRPATAHYGSVRSIVLSRFRLIDRQTHATATGGHFHFYLLPYRYSLAMPKPFCLFIHELQSANKIKQTKARGAETKDWASGKQRTIASLWA